MPSDYSITDSKSVAAQRQLAIDDAETYYIPMYEGQLRSVFTEINSAADDNEYRTFIAIAVAFNNTIIVWYVRDNAFVFLYSIRIRSLILSLSGRCRDHIEDNTPNLWDYEDPTLDPVQPETEVWGDRNCSNGHRPDEPCNADTDDILENGDAILVSNGVPLPRNYALRPTLYEGGDKIFSSKPIRVVRGAFPGLVSRSLILFVCAAMKTDCCRA